MTQRKVRTSTGANLVLREPSYLPEAALPLQLASSCVLVIAAHSVSGGPLCATLTSLRSAPAEPCRDCSPFPCRICQAVQGAWSCVP